ncbi:hypothetical protein DRJ04_06165 [Candidatus Aerophobetes bacterium]|uniref:Uncharacterized protein n=1 Tax=Aerophobetes bacterium TaxID=2030807 RepID=A0A662DC95_UNCAE|nr:MAG: hypothetical protein DRJ04_06165 [Candidatus Aerophobetes bacterium]
MDRKRYFSDYMHDILIVLLVLSMILIAQQLSIKVYKWGIILLVFCTFLQIGFGNIPEKTPFWKSMKITGIAFGIIFLVFGLGIVIAPMLIKLTRG